MRVPEKIGGVISGLVLAMFLYVPAWAQNPHTDQSPNQQQNPRAEQRPITSTDQIPKPEQNPNQGQNPNDQQTPNQNQQNQSPYGNPGQYPNQNPNAAERQNSHPGRPGSINYVEGKAMLDGQPLTPESVGNAVMDRGQVLTTQAGKVEVLLNPGIFLRIADNSAVKMISPDLANIEVEVDRGRAMVEATDFTKNNSIRIDLAGSNTQLLKNGLYDFDASQGQVRVFSGKANVSVNNQKVGVGEHHEVSISAGGKLKAQDFDSKQYSDDFYRWSGLRSGYLAEADADIARLYVNGGAGWVGAGWYWSPWFSTYTFIPGDGIFYSPFGWGFYSPFAVYGSPFFYGGYYGGYYGHPHHFGEFHGPYGHGFEPHGGFHAGGVSGGGFHGGGGGFHGGGGGGGGHH
jgi:hypothetical protein